MQCIHLVIQIIDIDIYSIANTDKDTITDHNEAEETAGNEAGKMY